MSVRDRIDAALATVYDPCSVRCNAGMSIVDMGLVTGLDIETDGAVRIALRPTSPWCTMIGSIMMGIEERLAAIDEVGEVVITIDNGRPWSEAEMTAAGRDILYGARAKSQAIAPVRPRQWQERNIATEPATEEV